MAFKIVKPNYKKSIMNISNSILKYYNLPQTHSSIEKLDKVLSKKYKNIVHIVFDGMGSFILDKHLDKNTFLQKHKIMNLTSVFPSTTVACLSSIMTGLSPKEHGWIAWSCYFKEYNRYIEFFNNKDNYTKEKIDIEGEIIKRDFIIDKISKKVETYTIYPAFKNGFETTEKAFENLLELCNKPKDKYIYFYWDEPDNLLHKNGCKSEIVDNFLKTLNFQLEELSKKLKDTLIMITADHGQIDIEKYYVINDIPELDNCLVSPPSMEKRTMSFVIKNEKRKFFKEYFNKNFGKDFILLDKKTYIKKMLGDGKEHQKIDDFVGDFVAIAIGNKALMYKTLNSKAKELDKACHAGLSEDEMIVPLIIIK